MKRMGRRSTSASQWAALTLVFFTSCALPPPWTQTPEQSLSLIPVPEQFELKRGSFSVGGATRIVMSKSGGVGDVAEYLREQLSERNGLTLSIEDRERSLSLRGDIFLNFDTLMIDLGDEGYHLVVNDTLVLLEARHPAGLFYGVQTILQLTDRGGGTELPSVEIVDRPRYRWRGMHLDVGRHFFPKEFIKRYIDLLAMHKMNTFHWHLTEDQGWRIEIKRYPKLTEVAAWRSETLAGHFGDQPHQFDGIPHGGYYSQEEIREVVEYARKRFVTIVPEIEMPGHSTAALAAYPELSCTGGPFEVEKIWGVHKEVYCAGREETFEFLEGVLTEVIDLFPGPYIHIGGDECPKDRWKAHDLDQRRIQTEGLKDEHELQSYFIRRIERFLVSQNRRLIGWDEILEGGLAPNAAVMSWRGMKGGIEAATHGHDVVMTPTSHCYFDYYQSENREGEPIAIGGFLPLEKVYSFEPMPPELPDDRRDHILGGQGNVWTEYMKTPEKVEYMALPRMCAMAEVLWSPGRNRHYDHFLKRLEKHFRRLDRMGVNYRKPRTS